MIEKNPASAVATSVQTGPKPSIMKLADEVRASASGLCDVKREDAFTYGMRLIYGGASPVAAKTGRT